MKALLQIYVYSVAGSALHCVAMGLRFGDPDMEKTSEDFNEGPIQYKLAVVLIPIVNTFFTFLFLLYLVAVISYFTAKFRCEFAAWGTKKLMGSGRFIKIRIFIVQYIFTRYVDVFYRSFDNDPVNRRVVRLYKNLSKNDKAKPQRQQNSVHDTNASTEETPDGRKKDHSDPGT